MGDENPIRTLRDYSKPSHDGYRNTIELPVGNNVVPLRSEPSSWCKTDAHSTDFGPRIQINTLRISLNLWTQHLKDYLAPTQTIQVKKSIPHVRFVMAPTTLNIA
ncbi:hypothetical protein Tco_0680608 [Tanacetum coccineum]|uniref:Uncharacterized protein n=1 Tax=Tanacetum coccineum TaxID=301880 RepID=A0ABQ4XLB4_9ASTR